MSIVLCPGCSGIIQENDPHNALSRYGHGDICSNCGRREAFDGDFIKAVKARHQDKLEEI